MSGVNPAYELTLDPPRLWLRSYPYAVFVLGTQSLGPLVNPDLLPAQLVCVHLEGERTTRIWTRHV